jgi:hypothetical protein
VEERTLVTITIKFPSVVPMTPVIDVLLVPNASVSGVPAVVIVPSATGYPFIP